MCHPPTKAQLALVVLFPLNTKFWFQSTECKDYKQEKKKKKVISTLLGMLQKKITESSGLQDPDSSSTPAAEGQCDITSSLGGLSCPMGVAVLVLFAARSRTRGLETRFEEKCSNTKYWHRQPHSQSLYWHPLKQQQLALKTTTKSYFLFGWLGLKCICEKIHPLTLLRHEGTYIHYNSVLVLARVYIYICLYIYFFFIVSCMVVTKAMLTI